MTEQPDYHPFGETIEDDLKDYISMFNKLLKLEPIDDDDDDDEEVDIFTELNELGLSLTWEGSHFQWLLGCGGPSRWFEIYIDQYFDIANVTYCRSWSKYEAIELHNDDFYTFKDIIGYLVDDWKQFLLEKIKG